MKDSKHKRRLRDRKARYAQRDDKPTTPTPKASRQRGRTVLGFDPGSGPSRTAVAVVNSWGKIEDAFAVEQQAFDEFRFGARG